ncbi:hypothetical protein H2203_000380 [Taxawa tesnikishii (nom. ined.)]|nr:hypothetical protein H2203_000380 [Dothideales sp. JES 119]
MPYPPQPAPRQRTAIACRYCRRRKIRCSGFDQSEDGRCTNCQRFSQECVFTPVSAQTQAFVPAAALNRYQGVQGGPPPQLYGAYGQPLPQAHQLREPYPPPPGQQPQQHPYPNGAYQNQQPVYQQQPPAGQAPQMQPQQQPQQQQTPQPPQQQQSDQTQQNSTPQSTAGQKRPTDEPHTPTLPPPNPANSAQLPHRGSSDNANAVQYTYPDPTGLTPAAASPASSTTSYISAQPTAQPYYAQAAPLVAHLRNPVTRVKINELVGPSGQQNDQQQQNENERARSAADSSMLNQLDRRM